MPPAPEKARILVVEDDAKIAQQICVQLRGEGFDVEHIADGNAARDVALDNLSLVILDLMLPGTYGMDLLKLYRERSDVPVLILSARQDTADKVRGLKLGADDYLTKPFWPEELSARVMARLRRPDIRESGDQIEVGPISLELTQREATLQGATLELTPSEFEILATLAKRAGNAMTKRKLVEQAIPNGNERSLDVHISRLRKKLGEHSALLETVWGVGFRLRTP